jgi:hypothetical protein
VVSRCSSSSPPASPRSCSPSAIRHSPRAAAAQRAVLFLTAGAFALDLAAVFTNAPDYALRDHAPLLPIVVTGIGEALSPVVLGLLLVAAAVVARPSGTAEGDRLRQPAA